MRRHLSLPLAALSAGFSIIDRNCANDWRVVRKRIKRMKSLMKKSVLSILILMICFCGATVRASDQSDVRATVQSVFEQLKAHDYSSLYDLLPGSTRTRMSRDRF